MLENNKLLHQVELYKKALQKVHRTIQDETLNESSNVSTLAHTVLNIENTVIDVWNEIELVNER